jgi:hypothetical protein
MTDGLITISLNSESDYINIFCKEYKNLIETPDGFLVKCCHLQKTAIHFCCGSKKNSKFQKARAQRLLWAKYILLNQEERKVLKDNKTKNIIFFFERKKTRYAVICKPINIDKKIIRLISGFVVGGKRAMDYREANPPYSYYQ